MTYIVGQTGGGPWYARLVEKVLGMPDWFKATLLAGSLIIGTILALTYAKAASAADVVALEGKVAAQQTQLDRIESKLDHLILKLIPGG